MPLPGHEPIPIAPHRARLRLLIRGAVQGVGFRPFIYRLATLRALAGWICNSPHGVTIEVEGTPPELQTFLDLLDRQRPPRSVIHGLETAWLDPVGYRSFEIRPSDPAGDKTALILPDIATCADCVRELFDPRDRRYLYPFINCTNCGPRYTIIEALPYDRLHTSMKAFTMCPECAAEYNDPANRRFHAQPNACPACGPHVELWDPHAGILASRSEALDQAGQALLTGCILAVKGVGGFHLMCVASDSDAVSRVRNRKHREAKPLAVMCPTLESAAGICRMSAAEERLLRSPEAPIVLLQKSPTAGELVSELVAPGNPSLGILLPYSPLHHVLLSLVNRPVVATSGNMSDEPICIDVQEALQRLGQIADLFLVHDRPIVRPVDDSVARVVLGRELVLRRARGYAPFPIPLGLRVAPPLASLRPVVLALGAHLKNTVTLARQGDAVLSQHIGDLDNEPSFASFREVVSDLTRLYEASPSVVAIDQHPDYLSARYGAEFAGSLNTARSIAPRTIREDVPLVKAAVLEQGVALVKVQHHLAHVFSCIAENEVELPALGVSWDGTGLGADTTIWGGEFFHVADHHSRRIAHFRSFPLPGGDQAIKEPRRIALGLLWEAYGEAALEMTELATLKAFSPSELKSLRQMLLKKVNSPLTSSAGRLFDAVASLAGLRQHTRFEGEAAMELEFTARTAPSERRYEIRLLDPGYLTEGAPLVLDWSRLLELILADLRDRVPVADISTKFHEALVAAIVAVAKQTSIRRVVLTGGCFQNVYLLERIVRRLTSEGFQPYWHQRVPPNDGGISLGQAVAALRCAV